MVEYREVRLWGDRVRMVQRYLAHPATWPDGIDTKYERWYLGHEDYWREAVKHLDEQGRWVGGIDDDGAFAGWADGGVRVVKGEGRPRKVDGEPWVEAGVSRRTWYRRKAAGFDD